jgi:hypothetical protein
LLRDGYPMQLRFTRVGDLPRRSGDDQIEKR